MSWRFARVRDGSGYEMKPCPIVFWQTEATLEAHVLPLKTTVQGEWNFSGQPVPDDSGHALNMKKLSVLYSK